MAITDDAVRKCKICGFEHDESYHDHLAVRAADENTVSLVDGTPEEVEAAEEATVAKEAAPLRGKLAEDFPGRAALDEAGHGTYAKVRALTGKGEKWWADVPGIGEATATKITEAINAKPEDDEE